MSVLAMFPGSRTALPPLALPRYGYSRAIGLPESEWGAVVPASPSLVTALTTEAKHRGVVHQLRICHHLEA